MNVELIRDWLKLYQRKEALKAELDQVQKDLNALEEPVQLEIASAGVDNVRLDGRTVYISTNYWPRPKDGNKPALVSALKASEELQPYVKEDCNLQSLRGWTNELVKTYFANLSEEQRKFADPNDAIPPELRDVLEIHAQHQLRAAK